jgi:hypothetical protein
MGTLDGKGKPMRFFLRIFDNLRKHLVPLGALLAFALMANADIVYPGQDVAATTISTGGSLVLTTGPIDIDGFTYTEWVFYSGYLNFVIQASVDSTSASSLENLVLGSFHVGAGVSTDVGYNNSVAGLPTLTGTIAPHDIDSPGDYDGDISFNFAPASVLGGQSTPYLIVNTDEGGTHLIPGEVELTDNLGNTYSGPGYAANPEPNLTYLLSALAVGVCGLAYRRKN